VVKHLFVPTGIDWEVYTCGFISEWNDIKSNWEYYFPKNNWSIRVSNSDNSLYRYEGEYPSGRWVKELVNQLISFQSNSLDGINYTAEYPGFLTPSSNVWAVFPYLGTGKFGEDGN
jgi:hypothetical protein